MMCYITCPSIPGFLVGSSEPWSLEDSTTTAESGQSKLAQTCRHSLGGLLDVRHTHVHSYERSKYMASAASVHLCGCLVPRLVLIRLIICYSTISSYQSSTEAS